MADLNSIESVLKDIQIDINNITSNTNQKNDENNETNFIDYSTFLQNLQDNTEKIPSVATTVNRIAGYFPNISHYLKESANYLKQISAHIDGNKNTETNPTNTPKNDVENSTDFSTIENSLLNILNEIQLFRASFNNKENQNPQALTSEQRKILKDEADIKLKEKELKNIEYKIKHNTASKDEIKKYQKEQEINEEFNRKYSNKNGKFKDFTNIATSFITEKQSSSDLINKAIKAFPTETFAGKIASTIFSVIKAGIDIYAKEQELGSKYARAYGGGENAMNRYQDKSATFRLGDNFFKNFKYGYTKDEVFEALSSFADETGRSALHLTNENIESGINLKRFGVGLESLKIFDTFGKSTSDINAYFSKLYSETSKKGLSFKNVSQAVKDNLKLAQSYTFSDGINGLMKMAETSTQLKFNMNEVSKAAEKVSTLEGAIQASANLSVLGGEFANFANPMQLMYEGLQNMEGLQDRIVNMFGNVAFFNKEKKQIDINPADKLRMKAAANALGVDYGEMLNLAMNNQRQKMIENQLKGRNIDKDTLEYFKNIGQIDEQGQAYVADMFNKPLYLNNIGELTNEQINYFKKQSEDLSNKDNKQLGDIFISTQNIYDKMDKYLDSINSKVGAIVAKLIKFDKLDKSKEKYFNSLSQEELSELINKYGNKTNVKSAIGHGLEDEKLNKFFGSEINRKYFDANYKDFKNEIKNIESLKRGYYEPDVMQFAKNMEQQIKKSGTGENYIYGKPHSLGGELRIVEGGEAILNKQAVRNLGVERISNFNNGKFTPITNGNNSLKFISVTPTTSLQQNGPQKISFEPLNINLNGTFELTSNGRSKYINLDDLDKNELKKIIMNIVKDSIPQINKQMMTLRDKGYNMEKDPFIGSIGYL